MQIVKESLDEGYCDISGRAGDLDFIGACSIILAICRQLSAFNRTNGKYQVLRVEGHTPVAVSHDRKTRRVGPFHSHHPTAWASVQTSAHQSPYIL